MTAAYSTDSISDSEGHSRREKKRESGFLGFLGRESTGGKEPLAVNRFVAGWFVQSRAFQGSLWKLYRESAV